MFQSFDTEEEVLVGEGAETLSFGDQSVEEYIELQFFEGGAAHHPADF